MKLLVLDTDYFFRRWTYEALQDKGVEIKRINRLSEIETANLAQFDGLIAHVGFQSQRDFTKEIVKYPIRCAIITSGFGAARDYGDAVPEMDACGIALLSSSPSLDEDANNIIDYFSKK